MRLSSSPFSWISAIVLTGVTLGAATARGQIVPFPIGGSAGGIYIDTDGTVRQRQTDDKEAQKARPKAPPAGATAKDENLVYVSLPKLFEQVDALNDKGKEIPDDLKYLGGMTHLRYVFVYPESRDLVIAGPFEPVDASNRFEPVGTRTGHPVMQFDDLVVMIRTAFEMRRGGVNGGAFGCSIDPAPDSLEKSARVMQEFRNVPRPQRMEEMRKALGPQRVQIFNTADDTRIAFLCVAADYKLKRYALGVEPPPVPGINEAVDNSRGAASRVWFEVMYEPLLVSEDGMAFEIRGGQRLQVKAGAEPFDPKGATHRAEMFAKAFTQKMPQMCHAVTLFAALQNVADLALLATLIRQDRLDDKIKWENVNRIRAVAWPITHYPVPKTAETLVNYTNGAIAAGGVSIGFLPLIDKDARKIDAKGTLKAASEEAQKLAAEEKKPVVPSRR
jgi:hypothetical protein